MKEKIKKTGRMSIEQMRREVAVATFKALLKRRGLYHWYFQDWSKDHWRPGDITSEIAWEKWAMREDIVDWVSNAFIWDGSIVQSSIWRALDIEWIRWTRSILNL